MKVGIDVGKGFVKVHDGESCFRYPSFYSINDGFSVARSDSVTIMNLRGHIYLLANNGSRPLSGDIMQPRDDSKTNGIQMLLHVLNVVATIHERRFGGGRGRSVHRGNGLRRTTHFEL